MQANNSRLFIYPETDFPVTNLDLSSGETGWTTSHTNFIDTSTSGRFKVGTNSVNSSGWMRNNNYVTFVKGVTYAFRYTISGGNNNMTHHINLGNNYSKTNTGNGNFTVYIKSKSTQNTNIMVVFENNIQLPTGSYAAPINRRISLYGMSLKTVDEYELDLYDNETIPLTFAIADVADISKRSSSFSKTITLPGTALNNRILKHAYNVSIDNSFRLEYPVRARLNSSGLDIFNGSLYLQSINLNNEDNTINYEANLYNDLNSLFKVTSEKYLRGNDDISDDIDLSEWNHILNYKNVSSSWVKGSYMDPSVNTDPIVIDEFNNVIGNGYVYPLINYNDTEWVTTTSLDTFKPALFIKEIWDKIINQAGYTYTSTFLNSDLFKRLVMPGINMKLSEEYATLRNKTVSISGAIPYGFIPRTNLFVSHRQYFYYTESKKYSAGNQSPVYEGSSYYDYFGHSSPVYVYYPNPLTFEYTGTYKLDLNVKDLINFGYINQSTYEPVRIGVCNASENRLPAQLKVRILETKPNGKFITVQESYIKPRLEDTLSPYIFNGLGKISMPKSTSIATTISVPARKYQKGSKIEVSIQLESATGDINGDYIYTAVPSGGEDFGMSVYAEVASNAFELVLTSVPDELHEGDIIDLNEVFGKKKSIKQSSILIDIIKMFNLYINVDITNPKNLIIEPRDNFYDNPKTIDWTQKVDLDSEFKIERASDLLDNNILFTMQPDIDNANTEYTKQWSETYGQNRIKSIIDTSDTKIIGTELFAPSVMDRFNTWENYDAIHTVVISSDSSQVSYKPRILLWSGLQYFKNSHGHWELTKLNVDNENNIDIIKYNETIGTNFYPYAGHVNSPLRHEDSFDLNFGLCRSYQPAAWPLWGMTKRNLVSIYYANMLEELTSIDSKKVTAFIYLTVNDIINFDFKNIYIINNVHYRVNKIFDVVPDKLTKVELLRLHKAALIDTSTTKWNTGTPINTRKSNNKQLKSNVNVTPSRQSISVLSDGTEQFPLQISNVNNTPDINRYSGYGINISDTATGNTIIGDYITVEANVTNSTVINSSNITLASGVTGVSVENSNNLIITVSNSTYKDGALVINGIQQPNYIDGSEDTVQDLFGTSIINVVSGGKDAVRNYGSNSIINIIDGN